MNKSVLDKMFKALTNTKTTITTDIEIMNNIFITPINAFIFTKKSILNYLYLLILWVVI